MLWPFPLFKPHFLLARKSSNRWFFFFSCLTRRRELKQSAWHSRLDLGDSSLFQVAASDNLWHVMNTSNKRKNRKKQEKQAASLLISWQDEAVTPWCVFLDDGEDGGGLTEDYSHCIQSGLDPRTAGCSLIQPSTESHSFPSQSSPSAPARLVTIQSVRQRLWIMDEPCTLWIELGISAVSPPLSSLVSPAEMWKRLAERNQGNSHSIKIEEVSVLIYCHGTALIHSFTLKAIKQALVERGRWQSGRDFFW